MNLNDQKAGNTQKVKALSWTRILRNNQSHVAKDY